jgi:hypothetical protein
LARLGCTRIGSPGIFGERAPKALFKPVEAHVTLEREATGALEQVPVPGVDEGTRASTGQASGGSLPDGPAADSRVL